uniref:alanine--tRNA ligase n=1 Tax=Cacopsylla melanoneura TaxID=428564 RepID=A0A8D8QG85_9HEMI
MNNPNVSSYVRLCSKSIRSSFLDNFRSQGHTLVKSSPVVPYCDPSIAFVNSGMCQFKNVFLGLTPAPYPRVVNSQKCIRVGGKHNDLACAGRDSYHHTFFEMLGNWSFNDYYKRDACRMALAYLTRPPVSLPLSRLYFTYFGGSEALDLPCDEETREIWLELGVPASQLKREGMKSNFWEMGSTGPCGYSSEIHYDLKGDPGSALARVNADVSDLIEIWNIVFISYNRTGPDSIVPLANNFVDTGLGFERLVTILQDKRSTYDTDLFVPLLQTISKVSGVKPYSGNFADSHLTDLDTNYRMLSDYSRMITVALADNMFPDATAKLRNVVRDALIISEDVFQVKQGKLLKDLTYCLAEILGESYPEIRNGLNRIQLIISEESRIFDNLRKGAVKEWQTLVKNQPELKVLNVMEEPGLVSGVKYLNKQLVREPGEISGETAFTLYDTHGLSKNIIEKLAAVKTVDVDMNGFNERLNQLKASSKEKSSSNLPEISPADVKDLPLTNDSAKYNYQYNTDSKTYTFPSLDTNLVGIVLDDQVYSIDSRGIYNVRTGASSGSIQLEHNMWVGLVFDATNFYTRAGGQEDDIGVATLTNPNTHETSKIEIGELTTVEGRIVHFGNVVSPFKVTPTLKSSLDIDARVRLGYMRAHTTSHLMNAALQRVLTCTHQKSCRVSSDVSALDFSVYGETLNVDSVARVEDFINDVISKGVPVKRRHVSASEMTSLEHVTVIPGEVYPDDVILIDISNEEEVVSREPCCGTHVYNTEHIESCTILGYKSYNHGVRSIKCLTGHASLAAVENGKRINAALTQLEEKITNTAHPDEETLKEQLAELRQLKQLLQSEAKEVPFVVLKRSGALIDALSKSVRLQLREAAKVRIIGDIADLCKTDLPYIVHYVRDDNIEVQALPPLSEITKPFLILVYCSGELKGRAYVPPLYVSGPGCTAQAWLAPVLEKVGGKSVGSKDVERVCSMQGVKIGREEVEGVVSELMRIARSRAKEMLGVK